MNRSYSFCILRHTWGDGATHALLPPLELRSFWIDRFTNLLDLSASAPAIISLRSFEIWLVVKADCRDPSDSEVSGLCFDFFLILNVLLEN
jgi:hypothetical protein